MTEGKQKLRSAPAVTLNPQQLATSRDVLNFLKDYPIQQENIHFRNMKGLGVHVHMLSPDFVVVNVDLLDADKVHKCKHQFFLRCWLLFFLKKLDSLNC